MESQNSFPGKTDPISSPLAPGGEISKLSAAIAFGLLSAVGGCGGQTTHNDYLGNAIDSGSDAGNDCSTVTFAVAARPQNQNLVRGSTNNLLACFDITNGCTEQELSSLTLHQGGMSTANEFTDNFSLNSDYPNVVSSRGSYANWYVFFDNLSVNLPPNSFNTICINGDVSPDAARGAQVRLEIMETVDVELNPGAEIAGSFPLSGPTFNIY